MRMHHDHPCEVGRPSANVGLIRVHSLIHGSTVNGPDVRSVVWVQGCSLRCPGCFNPETHPFNGGTLWSVPALAEELAKAATKGLTVSGGEPTDQIAAVVELLGLYRRLCDRTILAYSGREYEEIEALPDGAALLRLVDAAVLGRYRRDIPERIRSWGSSNQKLHLLSDRLRAADFASRDTEILIHPDGTCTVTGYPDSRLVKALAIAGQGAVYSGVRQSPLEP